ncbi:MAG: hypothetical protein PHW14_04170 [Candidatus Omnitrophica bacterium]|nr:hypothetical protein [Candidatus Omnitrophota bacterium]
MTGKIFIAVFLSAFLFVHSPAHGAGDASQLEIEELRREIREIREMAARYEAKIAELEARVVQQERKSTESEIHAEHGHSDHVPGLHHNHGMLGDKVKPIGAIDARYVRVDGEKNTLFLHEANVGVQADITDWLFGFITLTKHHGHEAEIEEAYARLHFEEWGLSAKPGKFFVNFGPENIAHFSERRTITLSAMHEGMFGSEPWADTGAQFDWRIPFDHYSNVSFSVLNGDNPVSFGDGTSTFSNNNMPVAVSWTNAFETENGLLRFGPELAYGQWDRDDKYNVYIAGGEVYYKWGNFDAQAELMYRSKEEMPGVKENNAYGYYAWGAYNFSFEYKYLRGIELLAGFGQFLPDTGDRETRITPQVAFIINDYAKVRAAYEIRDQYPKDSKDNRFITQCVLSF